MEGLIIFALIVGALVGVPWLAWYLEEHPPPEETEEKDVPLKAFFFDM